MPATNTFLHEALFRDTDKPGNPFELRLDLSDLSAEELRQYGRNLGEVGDRFQGMARACATLCSIAGDEDCGPAASHVLSEASYYIADFLRMAQDVEFATSDIQRLADKKEAANG